VEHAFLREAPVAPGKQAGEIDLEIARRKSPRREFGPASEQHAPVPEGRPLTLLFREMRVDLDAALARERPVEGFKLEIKRRDAMNEGRRHAAYFAFIPVVFLT